MFLGKDIHLWNEFHPNLYTLDCKLTSSVEGQSYAHEKSTTFGMREVEAGEDHIIPVSYTHLELTEEGHTLVAPSPLSVHLDNGTVWGNGSHLKRVSHRQANEVLPSPFYKRSEVKDVYNEMTLSFREHFNLIFRMYNEGMAYRFAATGNRPFKVTNERCV